MKADMRTTGYREFLQAKSQAGQNAGFEPLWMPDFLFDFQKLLVDWSVRKGRCAIFADCGLGKTAMQLVWAQNVVQHTNKPVLILTPLAVAQQTIREAERFGIEAKRSRAGEVEGKIVVANYERLHHFDPSIFSGIVCDESSILKSLSGATRKQLTRFMSKTPYRLLCTATPSPNDYVELGTSSEALGELSHSEMLKRFFRQLDDKGQKQEQKKQDEAETLMAIDPNYFKKLAFRISQTIGQWRLKHHAVTPFWRWVTTWAKACRTPSDLGCDDTGFVLPELIEREHVIILKSPPPGMLFNLPAIGMGEERKERRRTLHDRCEFVADLVQHDKPAAVWCQMNPEGDLLEEIIPDAQQIAGCTPEERKVELYEAFASGQLRVIVIKPKIGAWGLNWQHCAHVVTFVSHSYEQHKQLICRCQRFGQKQRVTIDTIATEGEIRVLENLKRKADRANRMFEMMIREMNNATSVERDDHAENTEVPTWLQKNSA